MVTESSDSEVEEESIGEAIASGSDEGDSDREAEEGLQEQVADIPFEDLQKARSDGGATLFSCGKQNADTKRANKNRPMEVTSKKLVPRFRDVIQAPKRVIRDPRFETLCGKFEESRFKLAYRFLYNDNFQLSVRYCICNFAAIPKIGWKELARPYTYVMKKSLQMILHKKKEDVEAQASLTRIDKQLHDEEDRRKQASKTTQKKSKENQSVKQGKKPYYLKKSEIRMEELVEKFKELKSSGKLEKYMAKRRQRNVAKDHIFVYYRQNVNWFGTCIYSVIEWWPIPDLCPQNLGSSLGFLQVGLNQPPKR